MEIKGYGEDISIEAGNVLRYFIEHCTERELELALETTFDNMNIVNVVRFYMREALVVCTPPAPEPSAKRPGS